MQKLILVLSFISALFLLQPTVVQATIESCTASVSPQQAQPGIGVNYTFTLTNTSNQSIVWYRINNPVPEISFVGTTSSDSSWNRAMGGDTVTYTGGTLAPAGTTSTSIISEIAAEATVSTSWVVEVSDDANGNNSVTCSGSLAIEISGSAPDTTAPTISNPAVSSITQTSATFSWQTDEAATTVVKYDTEGEFSNQDGSSTLSTSHSYTLSNLAASTTYYFMLCSADESGNESCTSEGTFETANTPSSVGTVTTQVVAAPTTVTTTTTVKETIILADTIRPTIELEIFPTAPVATPPVIEGRVVDAGVVNKGVSKIEYSLDNGVSWLLVDQPAGATQVPFSFVPEVSDDGNYEIIVRATDRSGNIGTSKMQTLVIDRLPPSVLHVVWQVGPFLIEANNQQKRQMVVDIPLMITAQAVGGVTDLEVQVGDSKVTLRQLQNSGLWQAEFVPKKAGDGELIFISKDGAGTVTQQKKGLAQIFAPPELSAAQAKEGTYTVWRRQLLTGRFNLWNAAAYGQENQSQTSSWFLPTGTYYVQFQNDSGVYATSRIFRLDSNQLIIAGFNASAPSFEFLQPLSFLSLWQSEAVTIQAPLALQQAEGVGSFVGSTLDWFDRFIAQRTELQGDAVRVAVVPAWDPRSADYFAMVEKLAQAESTFGYVVVLPGSSASTTKVLQNRGGYTIPFISDQDGELSKELVGLDLPVIIQFNRRGEIEDLIRL